MQESHPQTGIDLTYIAQSGDTSAPPAYAATGGDRYVGLDQFGRVDETGFNAQNQITNNSGSTTPTYDNNGNVTKDDAGTTYTYTAWNRMATTSSSSGEHFTYLPGGPEASVSLPGSGSGTFSFYSAAWQDVEDFVPPATGGTGPATTYVWGLENVAELVARDDTSGVRLYAQHDPNMDITALVNITGSVVNRLSYTPSGVITILNSSWGSGGGSITLYTWDYYWQGGRYDYYDGLYSFGYRNYSPTLGTWMEEDPTGYAAGPNVYQAMLGAPIEKTDPYGLAAGPATQPGATGSIGGSGSAGGTYTRTFANGGTASATIDPLGSNSASPAPDPYGSRAYWDAIAAAGGIDTPAGRILAAERARMWQTQGQLANDLAGTADPAARQAILAAIANGAQNWNNPPPAVAPPPDNGGILGGAIDLLGKIWGSPNSLIGLALGFGGLFRGGPWPTFGNNAIQFVRNPIMNYFVPNPAITLGNVVNYNAAVTDHTGLPVSPTTPWPTYDGSSTIEMGIHEEGHTYQSELLGPLFLPAYVIGQVLAPINPFEQAADNFALANGPHSP